MKHKEREEEKLSKSEVPAKDHFNTPVKNSGLLESCELQVADKSKLHTPLLVGQESQTVSFLSLPQEDFFILFIPPSKILNALFSKT